MKTQTSLLNTPSIKGIKSNDLQVKVVRNRAEKNYTVTHLQSDQKFVFSSLVLSDVRLDSIRTDEKNKNNECVVQVEIYGHLDYAFNDSDSVKDFITDKHVQLTFNKGFFFRSKEFFTGYNRVDKSANIVIDKNNAYAIV